MFYKYSFNIIYLFEFFNKIKHDNLIELRLNIQEYNSKSKYVLLDGIFWKYYSKVHRYKLPNIINNNNTLFNSVSNILLEEYKFTLNIEILVII